MIFIKEVLSRKIDKRCSTDNGGDDNNSLYCAGFLLRFLLVNARNIHFTILQKINLYYMVTYILLNIYIVTRKLPSVVNTL